MTENLLESLENQGLVITLNQDKSLTLTIDQSLQAYPDTILTTELADLIKENKTSIIRQIRARSNQYAKHRADMARYYAEKMRAIDMRRQGLANCGNCLFFKQSENSSQHGQCLNIKAEFFNRQQTRQHKHLNSPIKPTL